MTFKGMLKILMNDYRKQHEEKMFSVVNELMRTRRELREVKEQLRLLSSANAQANEPTINLFVQFYGFFNELCVIRRSIPIGELLVQFREITGIPQDHPIRLRVLSEDGSETLFILDDNLDRTLESFKDQLKDRMILSIEENDDDENNSRAICSLVTKNDERTYSSESDV